MKHCSMYGKLYGTHQCSSETVIWDRAVTNVGKGWPATEYGTSRQATCDRCKRGFLNQQHRAPLTQDAILTGLTFGACHPLIIPWVPMELSLERRVTMMTMGHRPFPRMFGGSIKISGGQFLISSSFRSRSPAPSSLKTHSAKRPSRKKHVC